MGALRFTGPADSQAILVLAHGAGAGMATPFMRDFAKGLGARGVRVVRFEFPYMQRRRSGVRAPPDRTDVLLEAYKRMVARVGEPARLCIGGKSLGGRMASMIADELGVRGLVCLGYPFHPPRDPARTRTSHLETLKTPCLIVQGTRDPFGTREEIRGYRLSKQIEVAFIEDGDHSLAPRKRAGFDPAAARVQALELVARFVHARVT